MKDKDIALTVGLIGLVETLPMRYKKDSDLRGMIKPKDKSTKQRRAKNKVAAKSKRKNRG